MAEGPRYRVHFRRRRDGKTNYRYRLKLLKSGKPRAVVRITNARVLVTLTRYDPHGDLVAAQAQSTELSGLGFGERSLTSTTAAYLTGYLAGVRSLAAGHPEAVLDGGLTHPTPGGRVMGALKGLVDAGLQIPHSQEHFPSADRISGQHLKEKIPVDLGKMIEKIKNGVAPSTKAAGKSA